MKEKITCRILRCVGFVVVCVILTMTLNWVTMPPNVVWMNLNKVKNEGPYDYLFVGTSHGQYGISPEVIDEITGKKSFNLCMADEYPVDTYYLMKEACKKGKPEKIIYELDPSYWILDQRLGSTSIFFYKEFPWSLNKMEYFANKIMELDFRETLFPWAYYRNLLPQMRDTVEKKCSDAYREYSPEILEVPGGYYKSKGFLYRNKPEGEEKGTFNNVPWDEGQIRPQALVYFEKMVEYCEKEGIELQVIMLPVSEETVANMPDSYAESDRYFAELMRQYDIPYWNFNMDETLEFDRSMNSYWDYDGHMYGEDGEVFSRELGEFLKE